MMPQATDRDISLEDFKQLVFNDYIKQSFAINDFTFTIRTLTQVEYNEIFDATSHLGGMDNILKVKKIVLSKVVVAVNNRPIDSICLELFGSEDTTLF